MSTPDNYYGHLILATNVVGDRSSKIVAESSMDALIESVRPYNANTGLSKFVCSILDGNYLTSNQVEICVYILHIAKFHLKELSTEELKIKEELKTNLGKLLNGHLEKPIVELYVTNFLNNDIT